MSLIKPKSHLNQKYDQKVKVSDSSELLKQVLGNEVPEGVLWKRVTAKLLSRHLEEKKSKHHNSPCAKKQ